MVRGIDAKRGTARRQHKGGARLLDVALVSLLSSLAACRPSIPRRTIEVPPVPAAEAQSLVARAEDELRTRRAPSPLDDPQTLEDVRAALQMDRIDLFAAAVRRADAIGGYQAAVLGAQIELAWGEAQFVVAAILTRSADGVEALLQETSSQRALGAERARLEQEQARLRDSIVSSRRLADALRQRAAEHVRAGVERTEALRASDPARFLTLRLAADFHRVQGAWADFDACVRELERARPDSTGLKFQRGAAAMRRNDLATARRHLEAAIADDPQFTRAQVFLLGAQRDAAGIRRHWAQLTRISPDHQLVVWAGPLIERILLAAE